MLGSLAAVQVSSLQGEAEAERRQDHQEQRSDLQHHREMLPGGDQDEVPHSRKAENVRVHGSPADCEGRDRGRQEPAFNSSLSTHQC